MRRKRRNIDNDFTDEDRAMIDKYADSDNVEVPDGASVKCNLIMMDGRPLRSALMDGRFNARDHQPHYATDTKDARRAALDARAEYVKRLSDSWRLSGRDAPQPDLGSRPDELMRSHLQTESNAELQGKRDRIWAQYRDQLANAWRTNPQAASAIERQGEQWRGGR
jgi:hypothetical protein